MGGGSSEAMERSRPTENDIMSSVLEAISREDKVMIKTWKGQGAPGLKEAKLDLSMPPRRGELMSFVESQSSSGSGPGWKALLKDRESAQAMATIRARVNTLLEQGRAAVEGKKIAPDAGSRRLNARWVPSDPFRSSQLNPLEHKYTETGWDSRVRAWTGRMGLSQVPKENTSFWCESWGGSASDKAVDSEFNGYVKKKGQKHYAPIAEHVRGWR